MHTAYGFSRSAGAAAALARAKANIGNAHHNANSLGGVHKLGDEMYEAFYLVCDDADQGGERNHPLEASQNEYFEVSHNLWMLDKYPALQRRYPDLFKQAHPDIGVGLKQTMH